MFGSIYNIITNEVKAVSGVAEVAAAITCGIAGCILLLRLLCELPVHIVASILPPLGLAPATIHLRSWLRGLCIPPANHTTWSIPQYRFDLKASEHLALCGAGDGDGAARRNGAWVRHLRNLNSNPAALLEILDGHAALADNQADLRKLPISDLDRNKH